MHALHSVHRYAQHGGFSVGLRAVVMYPGASTSADSHDISDEGQP
jgi:hypothetical protein